MTLVLSQDEVRQLLPMEDCVELMERAMRAHAEGSVTNPLRWPMHLADGRGLLGMMPGATEDPATVGLKVVAIFPANHDHALGGARLDSHQGLVVLFDPENGVPLGIFDASEITALRTAAVSAVATRALAREQASDLALLGSGVQAHTHLAAMRCVRPIERVRVFSRSAQNRERFAEREARRHGIPVVAMTSAEDAVRGADLVCTTTSSNEPVLRGEWLAPGAHINAAGACQPQARELDATAVARARLYTDSRESLEKEAGDWRIARAELSLADEHVVGEIGEVLLGRVAGRGSAQEITLYESLGLAVQDLFSGWHLLQRARAAGVGTEVNLGGEVNLPGRVDG